MKRIGIITFHRAWNYGSVLQAWALQDILKNNGYYVEIIDYEPQHLNEIYSIFSPQKSLSALRLNLKRLPLAPMMAARRDGFLKFRAQELHLSDKKYTYDSDLIQWDELYDCIICGSDQIWNVIIKDCDPAFFLPDVKKARKIAYAVSMGNSDFTALNASDQVKYRDWISDYDAISVREEKTRYKLNSLLTNEIPYFCALDPTLLHLGDDYRSITAERAVPGEYIFLYNIWNPEDGFEMAKAVTKRMGMPVYTIMTIKSIRMLIHITELGIKTKAFQSSPGDYLSFIRNASFVLTDSFHGTAFSIIFEKPFLCINYKMNDGKLKDDVRLNNILGLFNLQDRYISKEMIDSFDFENKPDYKPITEKRMRLANESIQWLLNAIEKKLD